MLREEEYESVGSYVEPLLRSMYAGLEKRGELATQRDHTNSPIPGSSLGDF
jgi:hypothetical protein